MSFLYRWKWLFGLSVISSLKAFWKTAFFALLLILVVLFLGTRAMCHQTFLVRPLLCYILSLSCCLRCRLHSGHDQVRQRTGKSNSGLSAGPEVQGVPRAEKLLHNWIQPLPHVVSMQSLFRVLCLTKAYFTCQK